jgi:hypothetical protein
VSVPTLGALLNPRIIGQSCGNWKQWLLTCMIITSVGQNYVFRLLHSPCRNKIKHLKIELRCIYSLTDYSSNCVERCKKNLVLWSRAKWPHRSVLNLPRNDQGRSKPVIILYLTSTHLHLYIFFFFSFSLITWVLGDILDANCSSWSIVAIYHYAAFLGWLVSAAQWKICILGTPGM